MALLSRAPGQRAMTSLRCTRLWPCGAAEQMGGLLGSRCFEFPGRAHASKASDAFDDSFAEGRGGGGGASSSEYAPSEWAEDQESAGVTVERFTTPVLQQRLQQQAALRASRQPLLLGALSRQPGQSAMIGGSGLIPEGQESALMHPSASSSSPGPLLSEARALSQRPVGFGETHDMSLAANRRAGAYRRAEAAVEGDGALLEMHPDRLGVQQELLSAVSTGRLLAICTTDEVAAMDTVNLVTAVHRLAKLASTSRSVVVSNPRFESLMESLSEKLQELNPRGLANAFWALAQLQQSPPWLPELLRLCLERRPGFSARDLSSVLGSLAKFQPGGLAKKQQQRNAKKAVDANAPAVRVELEKLK
ncbi:unnamed protein product, partial [Polarella glacialis]